MPIRNDPPSLSFHAPVSWGWELTSLQILDSVFHAHIEGFDLHANAAAVRQVWQHLPTKGFVLRSDVKFYYASLDHFVLLDLFAGQIRDRRGLDPAQQRPARAGADRPHPTAPRRAGVPLRERRATFEVARSLAVVRGRIIRLLRRHDIDLEGDLDDGRSDPLALESPVLAQVRGASLLGRVATGPWRLRTSMTPSVGSGAVVAPRRAACGSGKT